MAIDDKTHSAFAETGTIVLHGNNGRIVVEDADLLFQADFQRAGPDLLLVNPGSPDILIVDYFKTATPADLHTADGAILRGDVVLALAGPVAPGQYAQVGQDGSGVPIGQVESLQGPASVQRGDGTTEALTESSRIFLGDVVQTLGQGELSITFVDGTIFSLAANSRMVIDELIYTPDGTDNSATFNLVQGGFIFIAGQVARTGGMEVTTPAATMGIRGTTILVDVQASGSVATVEFTLTRDPDGDVGRGELFDLDGNLIALVTATDTKWIVSTEPGLTREIERTATDEAEDNVLIAEAIAAYQSALSRFGQEGSFVTLDTLGRGGGGANTPSGTAPDSQLELNSQDAAPPPPPPPPEPTPEPPESDGTFDEGRLSPLLREPGVLDVFRTALEDTPDDPVIGALGSELELSGTFTLVEGATHGSVDLAADGSYVYVPDVDFNGTDQFIFSVIGPDGQTSTGTVTIEVTPVNDAPRIEDANLGALEDQVLLGVAEATDVEGDALVYNLGRGAEFGVVAVTATGAWSYTPDPDFAGIDSFEILVSDAVGAVTSHIVTVNVAGVNDPPVMTNDAAAAQGSLVEGGEPAAVGQLLATDADAGAVLTWSGDAETALGQFTIDSATGAWRYDLSPAAEALAEGQEVVETFTATVTDEHGASADQTVTITLIGTNDAPRITGGDTAATLVEDSATIVEGTLVASDVDAGSALVWTASGTGTYGAFTIDEDTGAWSYRADPSLQQLGEGDSVTETFTATVTDERGASADQTVTITLIGTNDAPRITGGDTAATLVEDAATVVEGNLVASDVDAGTVLTWTATGAGTFGAFTIDEDTGAWSYRADPSLQQLGEGESVTETFTATVTDEHGASANQTVTITLIGTNDAPRIELASLPDAPTVTEAGNSSVSGLLTASDPDAGDGANWTGTATGTYGTFTINSLGVWDYTLIPAAEMLAEGSVVTESFTATVTDDAGGSDSTLITFTILGTNDVPVITGGDLTATLIENEASAVTGQLLATDPDVGAAMAWSGDAATDLGRFTIDPVTGAWRFEAAPTVEALAEGQQIIESFTATVTDEHGASAQQEVTITLIGANDAPVASAATFETAEGEAVIGNLDAFDADAGDELTFTVAGSGPDHGTVVIDADGSFVYTPDDGYAGPDSFGYTVTDSSSATSSAQVSVLVQSAPATLPDGREVTLDISVDPDADPAGQFTASFELNGSSAVRLAIVLDASNSMAANWATQVDVVATALEALTVAYGDQSNLITVDLIRFGTGATSFGQFALDDPALVATLRDMPFAGGLSNWGAALETAEAFFDQGPAAAANLIYFIADGQPSDDNWAADVLPRLQAADYPVDIVAFGLGSGIYQQTLMRLDPDAVFLDGPENLLAAFESTPLFTLPLVDLSVSLITDGVSQGEIADETTPGLTFGEQEITLPLAGIPGLGNLIGETNLFAISAGFDLDGDPGTVELRLFKSEEISIRAEASVLEGSQGSDILLGSDLADHLSGNGGNDILFGFGGDDVIHTGTGGDYVNAGAGDDRIVLQSAEVPTAGSAHQIIGGSGRDILEIDIAGDLSLDVLPLLDLSGIEALDIRNGVENRLDLALDDILNISDGPDTELEALLAASLPESLTIYGEGGDVVALQNGPDGGVFVDTGTSVTDAQDNTLDIYTYMEGGAVLATLAVDSEVSVLGATAVSA